MSLKNSINKLRQAMAASVNQTMMGSDQPNRPGTRPGLIPFPSARICPPKTCYANVGPHCMKVTTFYKGDNCDIEEDVMIARTGSGQCPDTAQPMCQ
jgi:hypothetical protein